jgi:hypothetical protein
VHVVHPIARAEAERLVRHGVLRAPALPEHVDPSRRVGDAPRHIVLQKVGQVVVGTGDVRGQRPHGRRVEEVRPDVIERRAARARGKRMPARPERGQVAGHGVVKVVVDEIQQLRGRLLGLHVDRSPVVRPGVVDEMQLVMRGVAGPFAAPVHHPRRQDSIVA